MSIRVDRLRYCFRLSAPSRSAATDEPYDFSAALYGREAAHLLASLDRGALSRVMASVYTPCRWPAQEAFYQQVHQDLRREAVRALATLDRRSGASDAYTEWRCAQLELFAEFLELVDPCNGYDRRTIDDLLQHIEHDRAAGRTGRLEPPSQFENDLLDHLSTCVRVNWDVGADLRERMLACDVR